MPLAFATILGGMVTLIGTPPNLIVSGFRAEATGQPFRMFDFTLVGGAVALAGLSFLALFGWRLLPRREALEKGVEKQMRAYVAELVVPEDSRSAGMSRSAIESAAEKADATVVAITRRGRRVYGPPDQVTAELGDILMFHAAPAALEELRVDLGLAYPDGRDADAPLIASAGQAGGRAGPDPRPATG